MIENYSFKPKGIRMAKSVFGSELCSLKGKTTKTKLLLVYQDIVNMPTSIVRTRQDRVKYADIMYVNTILILLLYQE